MFYIIRDDKRREVIAEAINNAPLGHSVEIKTYKKQRSHAQNRTLWLWINVLANEFGYTKDEMHEVLKRSFLGTKELTDLHGKAFGFSHSTTELTVGEFVEYLNKIEMLAVKMNIKLPYPDDYGFAMRGDHDGRDNQHA